MVEMTSGSLTIRGSVTRKPEHRSSSRKMSACTAFATMEPVISDPPREKVLRFRPVLRRRIQERLRYPDLLNAGEHFVSLVCQGKFPFSSEADHFCRINIRISQIICHHDTVQVLSAGCGVVLSGCCGKVFCDFSNSGERSRLRFQTVDDLLISRF